MCQILHCPFSSSTSTGNVFSKPVETLLVQALLSFCVPGTPVPSGLARTALLPRPRQNPVHAPSTSLVLRNIRYKYKLYVKAPKLKNGIVRRCHAYIEAIDFLVHITPSPNDCWHACLTVHLVIMKMRSLSAGTTSFSSIAFHSPWWHFNLPSLLGIEWAPAWQDPVKLLPELSCKRPCNQ